MLSKTFKTVDSDTFTFFGRAERLQWLDDATHNILTVTKKFSFYFLCVSSELASLGQCYSWVGRHRAITSGVVVKSCQRYRI